MPTAARKTATLSTVVERRFGRPRRILVVGCGTGAEAGVLARWFDAETTGIDIDAGRFDYAAAAPATLLRMDAEHLSFPDGSFDLAYSFHALEHIMNPRRALAEMRRVAASGGAYVIGTPNRDRLIGYISSSMPLRTKLVCNMRDILSRARGKWSNEAGAHAGFTRQELRALCGEIFGSVDDITRAYYDGLYCAYRPALRLIQHARVDRFVYPSIYVAGRADTG